MVRLASIDHKGSTKLVAQVVGEDDGSYYIDLTSIAAHARAFFELSDSALPKVHELIHSESTPKIPASEARLLIPLDPATCGKFLCIGMNYIDHCTEQNIPVPDEPVIFNKL
jgi:2-keto-4-pentenoate hydratase/2-oxohepta-3-ene-1,7-dioic acid hydratase in catechol pathway